MRSIAEFTYLDTDLLLGLRLATPSANLRYQVGLYSQYSQSRQDDSGAQKPLFYATSQE